MTGEERLALAALKGRVDGHVDIAKAIVRAACQASGEPASAYSKAFRHGNLFKAVDYLRAVRDIQRHLQNYCREVGYARE